MKASKEHKPQQSRVIQNQQRIHNHLKYTSNPDSTPIKSSNIIQCVIDLSRLFVTLGLNQKTSNIEEFYKGAHCYFPQGTYQQLTRDFPTDSIIRVSSPSRGMFIHPPFLSIGMLSSRRKRFLAYRIWRC